MIKKYWTSLIERTQNPMMPMIAQNAHVAVSSLGKALVGDAKSDLRKVTRLTNKLIDVMEKGNYKPNDPNVTIALCGMVCESIVCYVTGRSSL